MEAVEFRRATLFIEGQWVEPHPRDVIDVVSLTTEELVGRAPHAGPEDVDDVVRAAHAVFNDPSG